MTQAWMMFFNQLYKRIGSPNAVSNANLNFTAPTSTLANAIAILTTNTVIYTGPTGLHTVIDSLVFTNPTVGNITVSVYLCPVGDTPAAKYLLLDTQLVVANGGVFPSPSTVGTAVSLAASQSSRLFINNTFGSGATIVAIASNVGMTATLTGRNAS